MKKKLICTLLVPLLLAGCVSASEAKKSTAEDPADEVNIVLDSQDRDTEWNENNPSAVFSADGASVSGNGISSSESEVTITSSGTYVLSGSGQGKVTVDAGKNSTVHLVFNNLNLTSNTGPAIVVEKAEKVIITLADGSDNSITVTGENEDGRDAAVFSKDDLVFNGSGTLAVTSEGDGIHANDTLTLIDGTISISAEEDGMDVNDLLEMQNASVTITAGEDGIKTGDEESAGDAVLDGGSIEITSEDDGIDAAGSISAQNVTLSITSGGGHENAVNKSAGGFGMPPGFGSFKSDDRNQQPQDLDGTQQEVSAQQSDSQQDKKSKGLSAGGSISILSGNYSIDSADDAINSASNVQIESGTIAIAAGDDAIHGDESVTINGGSIDITSSNEGLEGNEITINDGSISLTASDDGINAASGEQTARMDEDDGSRLVINGGTVTITADGDGIDCNGSGEMNGGTVVIYGPESNMDGALDYASSFLYNGGRLIAGGSSGMASYPSDGSQGNTIVVGTSTSGTVTLKNSENEVIAEYESTRSFSNVFFSLDELQENETYTAYLDGEEIGSVTLTDSIGYINVQNTGRMQNMAPGGFQGRTGI